MPTVGEQMIVPAVETSDSIVAARFLLKLVRKYEEAVDQFSPSRAIRRTTAPLRPEKPSCMLADRSVQ
jgi:hypothetical protein